MSTATSEPKDPHSDVSRIQSIRQVPAILDICSQATGMGFMAIARVTGERWVTCAARDELSIGLEPGDELEVETTICHHVHGGNAMVAFDDAGLSPVYGHHPAPSTFGFRSYISMPIRLPDGTFFGTLCGLDPEPRKVETPQIAGLFGLCADLIGMALDSASQLQQSEADLLDQRDISRLREEFIGVIGHDLRNPIAAISSGLRLLSKDADAGNEALLREMQVVALRMATLADNLMDFTAGRLGATMAIETREAVDLCDVAAGVAREVELATGHPIETAIDVPAPVWGDPARIGQLLTNLATNAISHGTPAAPVLIRGESAEGWLRLDVVNSGLDIPPEVQTEMFEPYRRGSDARSEGIGLGLHIAAQIAQAHAGHMSVESGQGLTRVSFHMPLRPPS